MVWGLERLRKGKQFTHKLDVGSSRIDLAVASRCQSICISGKGGVHAGESFKGDGFGVFHWFGFYWIGSVQLRMAVANRAPRTRRKSDSRAARRGFSLSKPFNSRSR